MALDQNDKQFILEAINTATLASEERLKAFIDGAIQTNTRLLREIIKEDFEEVYKTIGGDVYTDMSNLDERVMQKIAELEARLAVIEAQ